MTAGDEDHYFRSAGEVVLVPKKKCSKQPEKS